MKITFLPSFKAGFDLKDENTKKSIRKMAEDRPSDVLAMHLAMKDIDSTDTLQLSSHESPLWGGYYKVKNNQNGFSFEIWDENFPLLLRYMSSNCQTYYKSPFRKLAKRSSYAYLANAKMMLNDVTDREKIKELKNLEKLLSKMVAKYCQLGKDVHCLENSIKKMENSCDAKAVLESQLIEKRQVYKQQSVDVLAGKCDKLESEIIKEKADFVESVIYGGENK